MGTTALSIPNGEPPDNRQCYENERTLNSYLREVDEQADEMCFQLVKQLAKQEGVTEDLKRRDQMAWVGAMNNIRDRVNEIVLNEVIFV